MRNPVVDLYKFRPLDPDEINFVLDSWTESYKTSPWAGAVRNDKFPGVVKDTLAGLIARGAEITVACEPETNRIVGWCCHETKGEARVIHFVYVRAYARCLGLGHELIRRLGGEQHFVTHMTKQGQRLSRKFSARFAPEIARRLSL